MTRLTCRDYTAALVGALIGWTCALAYVEVAIRLGVLDAPPPPPAVLRVDAAAGGVDAEQAAE